MSNECGTGEHDQVNVAATFISSMILDATNVCTEPFLTLPYNTFLLIYGRTNDLSSSSSMEGLMRSAGALPSEPLDNVLDLAQQTIDRQKISIQKQLLGGKVCKTQSF